MSYISRNIWRYCLGDKFTVDETPLLFVSQDHQGVVLETVTEPRVAEGFTYEQLQELGDAERLSYQRDGFSVDAAKGRYVHDGLQFADFPKKERGDIMWRKFYMDQLIRKLENGEAFRTDGSMNKTRLEFKIYVDLRYEEMQLEGRRSYAGTMYSSRRGRKALGRALKGYVSSVVGIKIRIAKLFTTSISTANIIEFVSSHYSAYLARKA